MKKAFDQNVSRSKPRLRLGSALTQPVEPSEEVAAQAASAEEPVSARLGVELKARVQAARAPKVSAAEAVQLALDSPEVPSTSTHEPAPRPVEPTARMSEPAVSPPSPVTVSAPTLHAAPAVAEAAVPPPEPSASVRRERLKERLKAVRENPRPEPLPPTVAEAGVLAVERISTLQAELSQLKAVNLALAQDLEVARRQAERATEEARIRMDEARRLSSEMEGRAKLLNELERELQTLEGERDEALLSLQESRQALDASANEKEGLRAQIAERDQSLAESLSEEERLAGELEDARDQSTSLRRAVDALTTERDTLARQVTGLTAERAELLEARKALEAVHRALASAVQR